MGALLVASITLTLRVRERTRRSHLPAGAPTGAWVSCTRSGLARSLETRSRKLCIGPKNAFIDGGYASLAEHWVRTALQDLGSHLSQTKAREGVASRSDDRVVPPTRHESDLTLPPSATCQRRGHPKTNGGILRESNASYAVFCNRATL
jgi:hypothetical protein